MTTAIRAALCHFEFRNLGGLVKAYQRTDAGTIGTIVIADTFVTGFAHAVAVAGDIMAYPLSPVAVGALPRCRFRTCLMVVCLLESLALAAEPPFDLRDPPFSSATVAADFPPRVVAATARYDALPPAPAAEEEAKVSEAASSADEHGEKADKTEKDEKAADDKALDPALVSAGQAAFQASCLDCHDADKSLQKRKSFGGWLATVKRMAAKADANVPANTHTSIATYLASVAGTGAEGKGDSGGEDKGGGLDLGQFTPNATIAPLLRGTPDPGNNSPDFFVDAWFGADWQSNGPLSATVMTCTSCHSDNTNGQAYTLEFVEASVSLDLKKAWANACGNRCPDQSNWSAKVKAGRFVVPFGAFAGMVHPGSLRTVANPLMFDMGRRFDIFPYLPVLPAPYSDEGVNLNLARTFGENVRATLDVYAVNGLQGDLNVSFANSRSYRDNNRSPFTGARATIGNNIFRFGGSIMGGDMQDQGNTPVYAKLYGADFTAQWNDKLRLYFEYALRSNGSTPPFARDNIAYGVVCEAEYKICSKPRISLIARYDNLIQKGYLFFADTAIDRYTWGFNTTLPGGSQLLVNHEYWVFSGDRSPANVLGMKWVASF